MRRLIYLILFFILIPTILPAGENLRIILPPTVESSLEQNNLKWIKFDQLNSDYISTEKFTAIKLEKAGNFIFKSKNNCYSLKNPKIYKFDQLLNSNQKITSFSCQLKSLLARISSPRLIIHKNRVRGKNTSDIIKSSDSELFETIWEELVLTKDQINQQPASDQLLAAALWFYRKNKIARAAFLLEQLKQKEQDSLYSSLHGEASSKTTIAKINKEISLTLKKIKDRNINNQKLALLIGINQYPNSPLTEDKTKKRWQNLRTPVNDILAIRKLLIDHYKFNPENIIILKNANKKDLLYSIYNLKKRVNSKSKLIVYYAGHGELELVGKNDKSYYWIPSDAKDPLVDRIDAEHILKQIKHLPTKHTLVLVDSCFSGALNNNLRRGDGNLGFYKLNSRRSRQLITSGGLQPVMDGGSTSKHSIFAEQLIKTLTEQTDNSYLSAEQLYTRLKEPIISRSNQIPTFDIIANSDDQSGEFYFVKGEIKLKDQDEVNYLDSSTEQKNEEISNWNRNNSVWGGLHIQALNSFHFSYKSGGSNLDAKLNGIGIGVELLHLKKDYSYSLRFNTGIYNSFEEPETKERLQKNSSGKTESFSSNYYAVDFLWEYNIHLSENTWLVLPGLGLGYQYTRFNNLMLKDSLESKILLGQFTFGARGIILKDFYWSTMLVASADLNSSGSLYDAETENVKNIDQSSIISFNFSMGTKF